MGRAAPGNVLGRTGALKPRRTKITASEKDHVTASVLGVNGDKGQGTARTGGGGLARGQGGLIHIAGLNIRMKSSWPGESKSAGAQAPFLFLGCFSRITSHIMIMGLGSPQIWIRLVENSK